jgi:putative acetyltransferase
VPGEVASAELRRAGPEDLDTVARLAFALHRHHSAPPMYLPYLPETEFDVRRHHENLLADPAAVHWLAYRDGRVLGMHCLQPPPAFISPMLIPEASTYLLQGYTDPEARGIGLGSTLLSRSMVWAREHGHAHCLLHFLPSNRLAVRFWLGRGFRSLERRLHRQIDPRVAWSVT